MYTISDLARMSGVQSHTIRVWEKRYELFEPDRTVGNHRVYSDNQLIRLLAVRRLVDVGNRISKVASWSESEVSNKLVELESEFEQKGDLNTFYMDEFIASAVSYDERKFNVTLTKVLEDADFLSIWFDFLVPLLQKIGRLWVQKKISPSQEHFLSGMISRRICYEIECLDMPDPSAASLLLFLPAGEFHDLTLKMTHYVLKMNGFNVIYLGEDVPFINIERYQSEHKPNAMLTHVQGMALSNKFKSFISVYNELGAGDLLITGTLTESDVDFLSNKRRVLCCDSVEQLLTYMSSKNY